MDSVAEIKDRLGVAEVVGGYIQLKQAGRNLKASCPFHAEKSASFMVSPEKGIWHCFGCQAGGDIFKFVEQMEGLDFRGALQLLAEKAGVQLQSGPVDSKAAKLKERILSANALAVQYFQGSLVKNKQAIEYLVKARLLTKQTIQDFQIGYAPESWEGLTKILAKKGYTDDELIKAGLAARGKGLYDYFRGRITLTICDGQGRPVGFTGRALDDSLPKYLNSPQTMVYDKSRVIYGLHLAKEAIRTSDEAVLVEGNMDAVASHQAGVKQVVAVSGTALTLDQLKSLSKFTKNIKLAFDQDKAGLAATERAIELAQKLGLNLQVIQISGAKDPDELIQQDPKLWQTAINEAKYVLDYLFDRFAGEFDLTSAMGKRQFTDRLAATVKRLADPVEQDHYVQKLAKLVGVDPEQVRKKVEGAETRIKEQETRIKPVQTQSAKTNPQEMVEDSLLAICLTYPEVRGCLDGLRPADFSTPDVGSVFSALVGQTDTWQKIAEALPNQADYVKILALRGEEQFGTLAPADRSLESFGLARRLQTRTNKSSKAKISEQLRTAEQAGDTKQVQSLLEKYQSLITEDL